MATIIRKGLAGEDWSKLVNFCKENITHSMSKIHKCGDPLSDEDAEKCAEDIYRQHQENCGSNQPALSDKQIYAIIERDLGNYSS